MQELLKHQAVVDDFGPLTKTILHFAVETKNEKIVRQILKLGVFRNLFNEKF
jgi:hypothetical protein